MIYLPVFIVTIGAYLFRRHVQKTLQMSWAEAQLVETNQAQYKTEETYPGDKKSRWLFAGPNCSSAQRKSENLVHLPMKVLRCLKLFLYTLPIFSIQLFWDRFKTKNKAWNPNIQDEHLFDLVVNSVLLVVAQISKDGKILELTIPDNIPLTTMAGIKPAGLKLHFDIDSKKITFAHWNHKEVKGDNDLLACFVVLLIIGWGHPQSHILAEKSAREIAQKNIKILEPSSRYVLALHEGLMYSPISPIDEENHFFSSMVIRQTMIDSAFVRIPHVLSKDKMNFRYYNFLYKSRGILMRYIAKYGIDVNGEYLFNNMIVHSVDHYLAYKHIGKFKSWTMDGSKSILSYFRAKVFWAIWLPDYETFIEKQRIKKMDAKKYPFYHDLYHDLLAVDKEFANCILASTSF